MRLPITPLPGAVVLLLDPTPATPPRPPATPSPAARVHADPVRSSVEPPLLQGSVRRSRSALVVTLAGIAVVLAIASVVVVVVRQRDIPSSVTTPVLRLPTSAPISAPVRPAVSIVDGEVPDVVDLELPTDC